jgi:hypothetical protein
LRGALDDQTSAVIYKSVNGVWQNVRNLPGSQGGTQDYCSFTPALSRDGKTIAQVCQTPITATPMPRHSYVRVYSGSNWSVRTDIELETSPSGVYEWGHSDLAIDGTGDTVAVQFNKREDPSRPSNFNGIAEVRVYKRGTAGGFSQVATLTPGAWRTKDRRDYYGIKLSFSGDGHTLAVGDNWDNGTGTGPRAAPLVSGTARSGAVYIYRLTDNWKLANVVKPNYPPPSSDLYGFGGEMSLSQTGKTLLVPAGAESRSATGIDGDWANADRTHSGAVFLY